MEKAARLKLQSNLGMSLSPEDELLLMKMDEQRSRKWTRREALLLGIDRWKSATEALETTGYLLSDDDYVYLLYWRELVEETLKTIPSIREGVEPVLQPLDERFRRATRLVEDPLGGQVTREGFVPWDKIPWWYFRYPRKLGPELTRGFRRREVYR